MADVFTTELDFSGIELESAEEIEAAVPYLPNLEKVLMLECGLTNDQMAQLNEEKATLEYEIQPLADTLNKAVKKMDKAQRGGIFSLFNKNEDTAYTELSAARTAYNDAMGQLDSLKHRIQKTFNEAREKALKAELLKSTPTPPAGGSGNGMKKEDFLKMSLAEKQKFAAENPEAYANFYK